MCFGTGALDEPKTLVDWGASIGPRTTNGEWWRLGTSMFVHSGLLQLLVGGAALFQLARLLERLVGSIAFVAVYITAGSFANLVNLSARRASPGFGASGAIFGIYGLLLAVLAWRAFHRSSMTIPPVALKRLVPLAVVFLLYNMMDGSLGIAAELTGLAMGFMCGLGGMIGASDPKPSVRLMAGVFATASVVALVSAMPLRGIADVWPELGQIVAIEDRTASDYQTADKSFRQRKITADALAGLIDQQIIPELEAAQTRLKAIHKVPTEHQPLMDNADRYLRLRSESWRLQAEGLRKIELRTLLQTSDETPAAVWRRRAQAEHTANLATLGNAEGKARASLVVLEEIRASLQN